MGRMPFWAVFLGAVVVVNAGAFAAYSLVKDDGGAQVADAGNDASRALRSQGLVALKETRYGEAVAKFTAAAQLSGADSDLPDLLKIAHELQQSARKAQPEVNVGRIKKTEPTVAVAPPPAVAEPEPVAAKPEVTKSFSKRPTKVVKSKPRRTARITKAAPPAAKAKTTGTLLVTSKPSGLMVEVDGVRVSATPAHQELEEGVHRVTLFKDDRRVFEQRVKIAAGSLFSLDPDVTAKLRKAEPKPAPVVKAPAPVAKIEKPVAPIAPSPSSVGELYILSPNVHGAIFINGEDKGFPPMVVKRIPTGKVKIEIRVDGAVRRTKTISVEKGRRSRVMFR